MTTSKNLSKLILRGQLMVNLPCLFVALLSLFIVYSITDAYLVGALSASLFTWKIWEKTLERWRLWAVKSGYTNDEIYKAGRLGLLNFKRHRIYQN